MVCHIFGSGFATFKMWNILVHFQYLNKLTPISKPPSFCCLQDDMTPLFSLKVKMLKMEERIYYHWDELLNLRCIFT